MKAFVSIEAHKHTQTSIDGCNLSLTRSLDDDNGSCVGERERERDGERKRKREKKGRFGCLQGQVYTHTHTHTYTNRNFQVSLTSVDNSFTVHVIDGF